MMIVFQSFGCDEEVKLCLFEQISIILDSVFICWLLHSSKWIWMRVSSLEPTHIRLILRTKCDVYHLLSTKSPPLRIFIT